MELTRRSFLKLGLQLGAGGALVKALGFDLRPALAQTRTLKIDRTTETRSICPYCSVSCSVIIHTLGDRAHNVTGSTVVHVEGDPDSPINRGTLCPKGITLKQNIVNDLRLTKVLYRAPGSDRWEEKSWDWAIEQIARRIKETRDRRLIERDSKGRIVNALTAVGVIGGCTDTNENNYLITKVFRAGFGIIPLEQQSRI
jgi:formate dehydrogenase major subunit